MRSWASVPFGTYFALYDQVGAPDERGNQAFGLVAEDGHRRPAWAAFAAANSAVSGSSSVTGRDLTGTGVARAGQRARTMASLTNSLPNPHLLAQLATWQGLRGQNHEDPNDWDAFRAFEQAIGAPDPGTPEPEGFRSR